MKTLSRLLLVAALAAFLGAAALAETVSVDGSDTSYETKIVPTVGGKAVKMDLTGAALRKRLVFKVYTIGSYVESGAGLRSAEDLASADVPKQLHLVMERELDGKTMANAFRDAVRLNYPAPTFDQELNTLAAYLETTSVKKGDHVWLTHVPGVGFQGRLGGQKEIVIPNPRFARAIWEIYLGKNNLGDQIKQGLTSRL